MLPEKIRVYFSFTKKERIGVFVLTGLIIFIFILPQFFPSPKRVTSQHAFETFSNEIAGLKVLQRTDSSGYNFKTKYNQEAYRENEKGTYKKFNAQPENVKLFYFDPNKNSAAQWKALGLREKTVQTIAHYLARGGNFSSAEGLRKVYGLHPDEYKRLLPYVRIGNTGTSKRMMPGETTYKQQYKSRYTPSDYNNAKESSTGFNVSPESKKLFYFDPNTINGEKWKELGLQDKTIQTITHYLARGGKFKSAEDLQKVYGLQRNEYMRLSPFVRIENFSTSADDKKEGLATFRKDGGKIKFPQTIIDINMADTTAFISLPGIGNKLANRIVNFRERLGGFFSIDQVAEIYGLPDSTFLKIKVLLKLTDEMPVKEININTADESMLKQHPYIRWNLAKAIVEYRKQHGAFKTTEELQQLAAVTPELFKKIIHYLKV